MYKFNEPDQSFNWEVLGDISLGRGNLGEEMCVHTYRMFQYALKKILTDEMGAEKSQEFFRKAGVISGQSFAEHFLDKNLPFNQYVVQLQKTLNEEKIGIMQVERYNPVTLNMTVAISEDLDCSGLPASDETVCDFDEGFIQGILSYYNGRQFDVHEVECWASGGRVCRFAIKATDK